MVKEKDNSRTVLNLFTAFTPHFLHANKPETVSIVKRLEQQFSNCGAPTRGSMK